MEITKYDLYKKSHTILMETTASVYLDRKGIEPGLKVKIKDKPSWWFVRKELGTVDSADITKPWYEVESVIKVEELDRSLT